MKKLLLPFFSFISLTTSTAIADDQLALMQQEIKHIVIVMLENRSFDNMVAWLYDEENPPSQFIPADTDPHYLGLSEDTLDQYTNDLKNSAGKIIYSCPPLKGVPSTASTKYINSPKFDPHEPFPHVNIQIFGDKTSTTATMKGFLQDYASLWSEWDWLDQKKNICAVMETYTDNELPIFHSLARHYAVSDYWFSSVPTQTNPNRAFTFCGTSEGETVNGPIGKNLFYSDTVWNRLNEHSPETTWSIFWQSDMLPGIYPGPYSGPNLFESLKKISDIEEHFSGVDEFHRLAMHGKLPDISFVEPQWTISLNFTPQQKAEAGAHFRGEDWIFGLQGNDFHPPGDMRTGENFLANIYTSLISNPEAWANTLLIVTFDEHGGLFDHIIPPASIAPDDHFEQGFYFDRYGVRIPTLLISPKINKGVVIRSKDQSLPFDHTSLIAMILKWKNIDKSLWDLGKRVEIAPTFESVFTDQVTRIDDILGLDDHQNEVKNNLKMGDRFYLKDGNGNYLCDESWTNWHGIFPYKRKENVVFEFGGGVGSLMHGSFILIKSTETKRGDANILESSLDELSCNYSINKHSPSQWWTIKSLDHPYVGYKLMNGDKVYLENHTYWDITQYVPCRLTRKGSLHSSELMTEAIVEEGCDAYYWIIEKI